jgi:predicted dehydrogenase
MGRVHAEAFAGYDRCELVALADPDANRLKEIGDKLNVPQRFADAQEMLDKAGPDAVSIAVPNKFHASLTLAAIKAGCHVLCEKPMAMSVAEAEQMKSAADKAKKKLMINLSYRYQPVSQALKQQIDTGIVGKIYFGRTVWHRRRGMPGFGGWFGNKELAGGGPLIDLGVHRIDLALWLMGHPEPTSVSGSTYNVIAAAEAKKQKKLFTTEDLAAGIVKFKNGATLLVEASWALNIDENERMITELYGEKGALVQRNKNGTYEFESELLTVEKDTFFTKKVSHVGAKVRSAYEEFIDCIVDDTAPSASAEHGIVVQKILNGLYRSAEEGREVVY